MARTPSHFISYAHRPSSPGAGSSPGMASIGRTRSGSPGRVASRSLITASCDRRPCFAEPESPVWRAGLELTFDTAHDGDMGDSGGRRGAERSLQGLRQSGLLAPPAEVAAPDTAAERRPGARHCWLTDAPGLPVVGPV